MPDIWVVGGSDGGVDVPPFSEKPDALSAGASPTRAGDMRSRTSVAGDEPDGPGAALGPTARPPSMEGRTDRTGPGLAARRRVTRLAATVAAAVRTARQHTLHLVRWAGERWRRSLQLRVATTTLLVSTVVVVVVGVVMINSITAGLLEGKQKTAIAEIKNGLRVGQGQLWVGSNDPQSLRQAFNAIVDNTGPNPALFSIVVMSEGQQRLTVAYGNIASSSIPDSMRQVVNQGHLVEMYAPIVFGDGSTGSGLLVGAPIAAPVGSYRLYYLFPLGSELRTVALVRRTVLLTGIVLVLLLCGIAALVTRQVVRPVRVAAQIAERFAAGRLEQRMQVRGKDEIALLAAAFNDMADSLQRQIRKLEDMSRLQRRFTSDVSHELRTPLTTVRMAADVLYYNSRAGVPPELARSAELLQNELDRFESLLVDLLEISRYDARVAVLEPEPVDLRVLVRTVVDATGAIARQQRCRVMLDLPDESVVAEVDARRVERILRNLIVNAVEHGAGRPIEVRLLGSADAVAVTVRDHGVGLRPGEAALVFDRFWRADPSRDRRTGGTGLGLSISLEDARLHGGWLHAWGRPGQGAQFRLTLPARSGGSLVSSPLPIEPADAVRPRVGVAIGGSRSVDGPA